jgi:hypothetical protein
MVEMFKEIQEKVGTQFADNYVPPVADHEGEHAEKRSPRRHCVLAELKLPKKKPGPRGRGSSYHQKPMTWLSGD